MTKNKKLLQAWDQLVKTLAKKEGFNNEEAVNHVRRHFPELYQLYKEAKEEQETEISSQQD